MNLDYPHVALVNIQYGIYKRSTQGFMHPSAIEIGEGLHMIEGDNYEDLKKKLEEFANSLNIILKVKHQQEGINEENRT